MGVMGFFLSFFVLFCILYQHTAFTASFARNGGAGSQLMIPPREERQERLLFYDFGFWIFWGGISDMKCPFTNWEKDYEQSMRHREGTILAGETF